MNFQLAKHVSLYCENKSKHLNTWKKWLRKHWPSCLWTHRRRQIMNPVTTSLAAAKDISVIATIDVASRRRGGKPVAIATCRDKNLIGQLDSRFTRHQVPYVKTVFTCWIFQLKSSIFGERPCHCSLFSWNSFLPLSSEVPAVSSSCGVLPSVLLSNLATEKVEAPWKQSKNK